MLKEAIKVIEAWGGHTSPSHFSIIIIYMNHLFIVVPYGYPLRFIGLKRTSQRVSCYQRTAGPVGLTVHFYIKTCPEFPNHIFGLRCLFHKPPNKLTAPLARYFISFCVTGSMIDP